MSIASVSRLRNEMCFCIICIDGHENEDISGRIFNAYYRDAIEFDNTMEMIAKLEDIFNIFGYPHQAMELRRSFAVERENEKINENGNSSGTEKNGTNGKSQGSGKSQGNGKTQGNGKSEENGKAKKYEGVTMIGLAARNEQAAEKVSEPVISTINPNMARSMRLHVAPTTHLIKHNAKGRLATLKTRVMFRQNAEWQGNARWLEEDLAEDFSSVLELMMLIDSMF